MRVSIIVSLILSLIALAQVNFVVSMKNEVGSETKDQNKIQPRVFNARQSRLSKFLTKLKPSNNKSGKQDSDEESEELGAAVGRYMMGVGAGR